MTDESGPSWPARHFDGETPEPRFASVEVEPGALRVTSGMAPAQGWPLDSIVVVNDGGRSGPVHLEFHGERIEALFVSGEGFLPALRAARGSARKLRHVDGGRAGLRTILLLALGAGVFLFAAWRWAVPAMAALVAAGIPASWERQLGNATIAEVVPASRRVEDPRITRPVEAGFARLRALSPGLPDSSVVLVLDSREQNAFAIPGGYVVVTTGLLRMVKDPDELAAVLAHEITHLTERHTTRGVLEQVGLGLLFSLLSGDDSALGMVADHASSIGQLAYSRADETEADEGATALLARAGIEPMALVRTLDAMSSAEARIGGAPPEFLSTHPASAGRREHAREIVAGLFLTVPPAAPDTAAWRAMEQALSLRPQPTAESGLR